MKIRLIGSADLVRAWRRELERAYSLIGAEYPARGSATQLRVYFDMDDRLAAAAVGLAYPSPARPLHDPAIEVMPRAPAALVRTRKKRSR